MAGRGCCSKKKGILGNMRFLASLRNDKLPPVLLVALSLLQLFYVDIA
jgi:hypothetical protein